MSKTELEEAPMEIVGGLDLHRSQITFRTVDLRTGELQRGRFFPGARAALREWLDQFEAGSDAQFVLEGTTGWRFAVEEIQRRGFTAHLADPAELSERRGPKRRAKTDQADCELMVNLLLEGRLPESWIPPAHILELRTLVRLRKTLVDQRIEWQQRLQAQLFHQGVVPGLRLCSPQDRRRLATMQVSPAGRQMIQTGFHMLDTFDAQLSALGDQLVGLAKVQPGCRALQRELYGVGWLTAVAIVAELGDCRRFHSANQAVRASGLDVTVYESNGKRPGGHLARQGPQVLRWALFEAAQCAARKSSPDHVYYLRVRDRIDHNRACLSVSRKICRRACHILKDLGEAAMAPPELPAASPGPKAA
jgi:transposase